MICPKCKKKTKVINTREPKQGSEVRTDYKILKDSLDLDSIFPVYQVRERECLSCKRRFTTAEIPLEKLLDAVFSKNKPGTPVQAKLDPEVEKILRVFDNLQLTIVKK
jgi:transcriptional regulator NrdR family protein